MNSVATQKTRILEVNASGRRSDSVSRMLTRELIDALRSRHSDTEVIRRDLADGIGLVDEDWIAANFTADDDRNASQRERLAESDRLVAELDAADVVVIGTPIYNFGVPASLKAWVDMIARARLTFRYTSNGPEGLLRGKQAYVIVASGGVPVDSAVDFATPYLRQALRFVGIDEVEVVAADRLNQQAGESIKKARTRIAELARAMGRYDSRAA